MSVPQIENKNLTFFKDEIYGAIREIESNLNSKFSELELNIKNEVENLKEQLRTLTSENNKFKQLFNPSKLKLDKIADLEKFKNKVDDKLITHEIRIKTNLEEIRKFQLRYDKLISENLYVPGFIGTSCQFKTLSDYLYYNISEESKIKAERDQMQKNLKELRIGQEKIMKSMVSLNESTVQICNTYADGKNKVIKQILDHSLEQLNQKSVEMKAMIHQFTESAKKIEDKSKEELDKIIEIKNNINDEIKKSFLDTKKLIDELNKKIKENNSEMNTNKRRMENLVEQMKEMNRNINSISMKVRNSNNSSNIMNSRKKFNISSSVSPVKDRKFKPFYENDKSIKNSAKKPEGKINLNKSRNKSEAASDLESIMTENSGVNDVNNEKQTKDMQVNTDDNEIIELKEMNYMNTHHTISNTNDINKNNDYKNKITGDSMNNTNSFKISSVQNSKNILKNYNVDTNQNKESLLPSILSKKEIDGSYFFSEESKKINDDNNNTLAPNFKRNGKFGITQYTNNSLLKIKNTKIVLHLNNSSSDDKIKDANNVPTKKRKNTINRNSITNINTYMNTNINTNTKTYINTNANINTYTNNNHINTNANINLNNNYNDNKNSIHQKKVKFNHRKEIILKRGAESYQSKEKVKEKQGLKLVSLSLSKTESDINKNKNIKDEVSSTIDNYRAKAFSNLKNSNENYMNSEEEMLDFPRKVNQAFGRTTYKFISRNDVINHINANKNINNFEYANNKNKK